MYTETQSRRNPKYLEMEEKLARQMARTKFEGDKTKVEVGRVCSQSEEIKELQEKIKNAYLNKERAAQLAETQMKTHQEVEQDARMDMAMLRKKEIEDAQERALEHQRGIERLENKHKIEYQMHEKELMRLQAQREEFEREKGQVEAVVNKLINEDTEMMNLNHMKEEQSKLDMRMSLQEKKRNHQKLLDLEKEEEENVRRYAEEQSSREGAIRLEKAKVEAERVRLSR